MDLMNMCVFFPCLVILKTAQRAVKYHRNTHFAYTLLRQNQRKIKFEGFLSPQIRSYTTAYTHSPQRPDTTDRLTFIFMSRFFSFYSSILVVAGSLLGQRMCFNEFGFSLSLSGYIRLDSPMSKRSQCSHPAPVVHNCLFCTE